MTYPVWIHFATTMSAMKFERHFERTPELMQHKGMRDRNKMELLFSDQETAIYFRDRLNRTMKVGKNPHMIMKIQ